MSEPEEEQETAIVQPPPSKETRRPDRAADKQLSDAQQKSDDRRRSDNLRFDKDFSTPFAKVTPLPDGGVKIDKPDYFESNLPPPLPIDPHHPPAKLQAEIQQDSAFPAATLDNPQGIGGAEVVGLFVAGAMAQKMTELAQQVDLEKAAGKVVDMAEKTGKAWESVKPTPEEMREIKKDIGEKYDDAKVAIGEFRDTAVELAGDAKKFADETATQIGNAYDEVKPKVEAFAQRTATKLEETYEEAKPMIAEGIDSAKAIGSSALAGAGNAFEAVKDGVMAVFEQVAAATAPEHEFDLEDYALKDAPPPAAQPPAEKHAKGNEQQL